MAELSCLKMVLLHKGDIEVWLGPSVFGYYQIRDFLTFLFAELGVTAAES